MNLKNNKGYVGVDATIAVIILMLLIPTIMGMVYRVNTTNHETKIKAEIINILVNTIEIAKGINLKDLTTQEVINQFESVYGSTYTISDTTSNSAVITTSIASYKLEVSVVDYHDTHSDAKENVLKTVKAVVTYKIGNNEKTMDLSTVIK